MSEDATVNTVISDTECWECIESKIEMKKKMSLLQTPCCRSFRKMKKKKLRTRTQLNQVDLDIRFWGKYQSNAGAYSHSSTLCEWT